MTNQERVLAIMEGRRPDRIPWIPRLLLWHTAQTRRGTLPERFEGMSLRQVERALRLGTPARDGRVFVTEQRGDVEVTQRRDGTSTLFEYRTPVGSVTSRHRISEVLEDAGIGSLEVEHIVKEPADLAVAQYLYENTYYAPTYDDYHRYEAEIGDDGYPLVAAGDVPFHHFLQKLAGYQNAYYLLADCPARVEALLARMEEVDRERQWPLVAESPARLILHGLHFDSGLTPPPLFERYITPYYRDLSTLLHAHGKTLCTHADNDSRLILGHMRDAGFDMAETFTTEPQASCTLAEARQAWGTDVIIWGAVPSVILEPTYTDTAFEAYMIDVFRTAAPGDAFLLGVADNVMPDALPERIERISDMVDAWGDVPIDPARIGPEEGRSL
jgi:uroporphyrinogen-III decarboxylase